MEERVEVPDSTYELLDRVVTTLCLKDTHDLDVVESGNVDVMLAEVLHQMHERAEEIADGYPVPGKVPDSVLDKHIPGYRAAVTLATYLLAVLGEPQ